MGTPFCEIYRIFFSLINDREIAKLTSEDAKDFLFDLLLIARAEFKKCKKNLDEIIDCTSGEFNISLTNKGTSIKDFLPFVNKHMDFSLYNNNIQLKENKDYIIKREDEDIKLTLLNNSMSKVEIKWDFDGAFIDNLNKEEKYILAIGMLNVWLSQKVLREENIKNSLGDRDFKGYSNANLLSKLIDLQKINRALLRTKKREYTYNNFKGFS